MISPHDSKQIAVEIVRLQRHERWYKRWRFLTFIFATIVIVMFMSYQKSAPDLRHVAMVNISGEISESNDVWRQLEKVSLENTQGLLVLFNSGGGAVGDSERLYNALRYYASKMPVEFLVENQAASGAYLAALAADKIYAYNTSIIGSIGVVMQTMNLEQLAITFGVKVETFTTGEYKGYPSPFRQMPEEVKAHLIQVMQDDNKWFIDLVKSRRGLQQTSGFDQAQIYTGMRGLEQGLIDGISTREEALARLFEKAGQWPLHDLETEEDGSILSSLIGRRISFSPKNWLQWSVWAS